MHVNERSSLGEELKVPGGFWRPRGVLIALKIGFVSLPSRSLRWTKEDTTSSWSLIRVEALKWLCSALRRAGDKRTVQRHRGLRKCHEGKFKSWLCGPNFATGTKVETMWVRRRNIKKEVATEEPWPFWFKPVCIRVCLSAPNERCVFVAGDGTVLGREVRACWPVAALPAILDLDV